MMWWSQRHIPSRKPGLMLRGGLCWVPKAAFSQVTRKSWTKKLEVKREKCQQRLKRGFNSNSRVLEGEWKYHRLQEQDCFHQVWVSYQKSKTHFMLALIWNKGSAVKCSLPPEDQPHSISKNEVVRIPILKHHNLSCFLQDPKAEGSAAGDQNCISISDI